MAFYADEITLRLPRAEGKVYEVDSESGRSIALPSKPNIKRYPGGLLSLAGGRGKRWGDWLVVCLADRHSRVWRARKQGIAGFAQCITRSRRSAYSLHGIDRLKREELAALAGGIKLIQYLERHVDDPSLLGRPAGRPIGSGRMSRDDFHSALRSAVARLRRDRRTFGKQSLARAMAMNSETLDSYLKLHGPRLSDLKYGDWPRAD
jgi:hypothetical protein